MPSFPQVFFLEGITRSGKSQVAMCLYHLIGKENFSSVEPHEMHGFEIESMAGKLINLVTDIKTDSPISANIFKQIEDRVPKRIRRKNRKDLYATIPSVHVFAGNDMPKNFDSSSQAYARRATIIKFNNQVPEGTDRKNYAEYVFNIDAQGIFNFAIWGLQTLLNSKGFFHKPESAKEAMTKWTTDNDVIALFIEDLGEGCLKEIAIGKELKMNRTDLWVFFDEWRDEAGRKNSRMTRSGFYKAFEAKGFIKSKSRGDNIFKGIGKAGSHEEARF
jgi:phage/plasmid-associated DNA primase